MKNKWWILAGLAVGAYFLFSAKKTVSTSGSATAVAPNQTAANSLLMTGENVAGEYLDGALAGSLTS